MNVTALLAEHGGGTPAAAPIAEQLPLSPEGSVRRRIDDCLATIETREPAIRAWAYVGEEQARTQADRHDRLSGVAGRFHGMPIGVKDVIATMDMPTAYGHRADRQQTLAEDAVCVSRARDAGAVVVGKTATAEFALSAPPATRHPFAPMRSPGGSSAGSAAAVASGMIPLALATQTGGSAIRPASYCGVIGFKPSFGLIDRTGVLPLSPSFDTVAVIGRTVDLVASFAGVIAQRTWPSPAPVHGLTVGLYATDATSGATLHPLVRAALAAAEVAFRSTGAVLRRIEPRREDTVLCGDHATIALTEARQSLSRYLHDPSSQLRAATRRAFAAQMPSSRTIAAAHRRAGRARNDVDRWFGDSDVLLAPAVTGPAPRRGNSGDPTPCIVWTLLHLPCLTLPTCVTDDDNLPIGVQLIARAGADASLIDAARLLERVFDERRRLRFV